MPLIDIVIDTNVLMHANNSEEARQQDSIDLINYLLSSTEFICVDEGFVYNETQNRSLIGSEYIKHLKNGSLGYSLIVQVALQQRIREKSRNAPAHISKKINQCISHEKSRDKTFLKVAYNSIEKTLVTHDREDFSNQKRTYILNTFGIKILDAGQVP